ncbi:MBL fold metallo-hydrolase [Lapidilactobacillus wuchangensis]|uniref:MBL fold metallo-hydrolase n=1 Tax=Lapidilactobacillus wuchangensis TaxID=2486001 RepID=UPI000F77290E|nr:MBL fold metallo-hydrolase [Lapidilactobacillus wuchangensis]
MKLTVLGYYGGYPTDHAGTTGFLIEEGDYHLLLDCGSGVLSELERHLDPLQLNAVLLTHYHQDHIADVGVLQYYWQLRPGKRQEPILPIYGNTEDLLNFPSLTWAKATVAQGYDPAATLQLGPLTITFKRTIHPVPTFAVRIVNQAGKVLVFTADSAYFSELADFATNADLLITDTNFDNQKTGKMWHMTSGQTADLAVASGAHQLILSHLPQTIDHQQLLAEVKEITSAIPISLAHTGLTVEL